ncbi:MAG: glycosyltransferase, partial [Minisyncoccia bacterium]
AKKWFDRIKWDLYGLKKWSKKHNIKADLIISLQNNAPFYFKKAKQIVYLHQSLPFFKDVKWNLFLKETRVLWFYQNIYPLFIRLNLKNIDYLIVQTEWMKKAVAQILGINSNKIIVITPNLPQIDINSISKINFNDNKFHIFYPAAPYFYKNHELIIKALKYIKDNYSDIFNNLIVHFTFSKESKGSKKLINLIEKLKVRDVIKLEGELNYQKVLEFYQSVDLVVFPSYIETFGLPLIEAANFGIPLLASDLDFNREIISNYEGAQFLDYRNEKLWAEKIIECYHQKFRFKPFQPHFNTSWQDLFKLINNLLNDD